MNGTMRIARALTLCLAAIVFAGCTNGEKPPAEEVKLPAPLEALRAELNKAKAQIDVTLVSLDAIVENAKAPKPHFDKFTKDLASLEAQAATAKKRGEAMRAAGDAYFKAWEKELAAMSSPDIVKIAEERKAELTKEYSAVKDIGDKLSAAYAPFISDLKDIKKILDNDLNEKGITSLAPTVTKTKANSKAVKDLADSMVGELKTIASIYSPAK